MAVRNNDNYPAYDRATIAFHWLTALLVLLQWSGAMAMHLVDDRSARLMYWTVHIDLGTMLFLVFSGRLAWRCQGGRVLPSAGDDRLHKIVQAMHKLLYALLLVLILLGFAIVALRGWHLIGLFTIAPLADTYRPISGTLITVHKWVAHLLMIVALGHALAALYHHWVLKDGVLRRMMALGQGG